MITTKFLVIKVMKMFQTKLLLNAATAFSLNTVPRSLSVRTAWAEREQNRSVESPLYITLYWSQIQAVFFFKLKLFNQTRDDNLGEKRVSSNLKMATATGAKTFEQLR